jgi:isopentenyl-diphosphate delta-isomerase
LKESVIIVTESDRPTGTMDKMAAHLSGTLHRAFSVFVFNSEGQLLLQKRALNKYHSGGLWTNTCCSHPRPGEKTMDAAHRRLKEEMGIDCELSPLFAFSYRHEFKDGLVEHEYDHVFMGVTNQVPRPAPLEVADFKYLDTNQLAQEIKESPEEYTAWIKLCINRVLESQYHLQAL